MDKATADALLDMQRQLSDLARRLEDVSNALALGGEAHDEMERRLSAQERALDAALERLARVDPGYREIIR